MTFARACWLTLLVGCTSPPAPDQVLDDLMARGSACSGVPTHIYDSQTAQREAQPVVDCLNAALAANTVAYTAAGNSTTHGCEDSWWFVTDTGRVRMFHRAYTGELCDGGDVVEDPGCAGPFYVDATSLALWAIQATGCVVVIPPDLPI